MCVYEMHACTQYICRSIDAYTHYVHMHAAICMCEARALLCGSQKICILCMYACMRESVCIYACIYVCPYKFICAYIYI